MRGSSGCVKKRAEEEGGAGTVLLGARFETIPMPSRFDGEIVPVYIMRFIAREIDWSYNRGCDAFSQQGDVDAMLARPSMAVTNNTQAPTLFI